MNFIKIYLTAFDITSQAKNTHKDLTLENYSFKKSKALTCFLPLKKKSSES